MLASIQRVYTQTQAAIVAATEAEAVVGVADPVPDPVPDDIISTNTNNSIDNGSSGSGSGNNVPTPRPTAKSMSTPSWIVLGLKQVLRAVKKNTVKLVLLAPDTEASAELDKQLASVVSACLDCNVPVYYCLSRRVIGKAVLTNLRQAAVAITNIDCSAVQPNPIQPPVPNPPVYPQKGLSISGYYSILYTQLVAIPPATLADAYGK